MGSETIGMIACDAAGCDASLTAPTRAAAELDAVLQEGWYYSAAGNVAYCPDHRRGYHLDETASVPIPGCTCGAAHRPHCEALRGQAPAAVPEPHLVTAPWIDLDAQEGE